MKIEVVLTDRDWFSCELNEQGEIIQQQIKGCFEFHKKINQLITSYQSKPHLWPIPKHTTHTDLLIKELILKSKKEWRLPNDQEELCHCRMITTFLVDQAIVAGAHDRESVSLCTGASTACGTCATQVEELIKYRLAKYE